MSGCSAIVGLPVGQAPTVDPSRDGPPLTVVDVANKPLPIPKNEPRIKRGNVSPYTVFGVTYEVMPSAAGYQEIGTASWYGRKFHGRLTSSGEVYDMFEFTAAHKSLPIPSYVQVTNLANQEQIIVRVNDRGPFAEGRIIDLSWAAAQRLGFADKGTARVELVILAHPDALERSAVPVEPKTGAQPEAKPGVQLRYQILALSDSDKAQQAMLKALESLGMDTAQGQLSSVTINERLIWRVVLSPANAKQTQLLLQSYTDAKLLTN
ncbi:MAG: septal ring lytic transglycosylase RlpA family protein [Pseudomonadales bacterium]